MHLTQPHPQPGAQPRAQPVRPSHAREGTWSHARPDPHGVVRLACRGWPLATAEGPLVVRGASPADLAAVAAMHGRCTGSTLLQRYRLGGRAPSLLQVSTALTQPLTVVAVAGSCQVVALGTAMLTPEPRRDWTTEIGLVVEDAWQGRGVGSALVLHLGAALRCLGYGQVFTRSATSSLPLTQVMQRVGETRTASCSGSTTLASRLEVSAAALGGGHWHGGEPASGRAASAR